MAPATCVLEDGDLIGLSDRIFEVIHAPAILPAASHSRMTRQRLCFRATSSMTDR
jgi:hypothetical protein